MGVVVDAERSGLKNIKFARSFEGWLILLREKLALLGEKLDVDKGGEIKVMKGIMNNGELATNVA